MVIHPMCVKGMPNVSCVHNFRFYNHTSSPCHPVYYTYLIYTFLFRVFLMWQTGRTNYHFDLPLKITFMCHLNGQLKTKLNIHTEQITPTS